MTIWYVKQSLLKNKKANGSEGIPELLKNRINKHIFMLAKPFEKHINGDQIPKTLKEAWIMPTHKKCGKAATIIGVFWYLTP